MLGVSGEVADLEGEIGPHTDQSSRVTCVVDFYGPSELLTMNDHPSYLDHNAPDSPESALVGGTLQETVEVAKSASPMTHVTTDDAPILIIHGTKDALVPYPQSVDFEKSSKQPGVSASFRHGDRWRARTRFRGKVTELVEAFVAHQLLGEGENVADQTIPAAR